MSVRTLLGLITTSWNIYLEIYLGTVVYKNSTSIMSWGRHKYKSSFVLIDRVCNKLINLTKLTIYCQESTSRKINWDKNWNTAKGLTREPIKKIGLGPNIFLKE